MTDFLHLFTTLSYRWPLLLLIPPVFLFFWIRRTRARDGIAHPSVQSLRSIPPSMRQLVRAPLLSILFSLSMVLLAVAAAGPREIRRVREPYEGRNLMLALDISKSMQTGDFGGTYARASRLQAVKSVVSEFISGREGDRVGLVVFGTNAYLQSPLTLDHDLVLQLVRRLQVGLAGDGTAMGDGLGLAVKRVEGTSGDSQAVILLTDGVSNSGQVNPLQAAKVARDLGITVHTVGIGSIGGKDVRLPGGITLPGFRAGAEFDEKTLKEIAKLTGGVYFHASDLSGLKEVYEEIDELETSKSEEPVREQVNELFASYALWGTMLYLIYLLFSRTVFTKVP